MSAFYEWQKSALLLRVKIQPCANKDEFCDVIGNAIKLRITAAPVDGKANKHLMMFLASQFKVNKSAITLLNGKTSREKRFKIDSPEQLPGFISPVISSAVWPNNRPVMPAK